MDFGFSEEQRFLRQTVSEFLSERASAEYARAMLEDPRGYADEVWDSMAELGWMGLAIPEAQGGSGLGILELALVCEELGAVVHPGPYVATCALGATAIAEIATEAQRDHWLAPVASGKRRLSLAVAERAGTWDAGGIESRAVAEADGYTIRGEKLFVPDARSADVLIVVAGLDDGLGFFAIPTDATGLTVTPMQTVDRTRHLDVVTIDDVRVEAEGLLGGAPASAADLDRVIDAAKVLLAADMVGGADRALALSVEYAGVREQFGRAIGTFQALQHRLADMKVDVENARSLVYYAAWAIDLRREDSAKAAATAKAYASETCPRVVADAIQVHGGIGFTWEHDLHLYYKRAKASEATYGDASANQDLVGRLLGLED